VITQTLVLRFGVLIHSDVFSLNLGSWLLLWLSHRCHQCYVRKNSVSYSEL